MKFLVLALSLFSVSAVAAYDNTWYRASGFSGEYPNGFSVVQEGVTLPGRTTMDKDVSPTLACPATFKAVYHPWNDVNHAEFVTMSKIVPLTVKENFIFETDEGQQILLEKGDVIEYLVYGAEGWFTVRVNGVISGASQDLFEKVEEVSQDSFFQEEWYVVECGNFGKAFVLAEDVVNSEGGFLPGLDSWSRGFKNEYGKVSDLTDENVGEGQN